MKSYTHFTTEERESLYLLLKLGKNHQEFLGNLAVTDGFENQHNFHENLLSQILSKV